MQADSDPRRWGMKLAEHGGKRGKKRAVIAVAVSSAQLGSLRLRDRARRIIQIAPGEILCNAGSGSELFLRESVLRRFYHRLIAFQRNPTFFQRLPQHAV